jgi:hypothetical protein
MGTFDNRDLPLAIFQQSFCYTAGLAVNLLDLLEDNSHCREMLAAKVGVMDRRMRELSKHVKQLASEEEDKIYDHRFI